MRGRIVKGLGGIYYVETEQGQYHGMARGIFRLRNIKPLIGDIVEISITHEGDRECSIDEICERKNELIRPSVANIDQIFIVFAISSPNINYDLLDKFLIISESKNLKINICINKIDIAKEKEIEKIKELYGNLYNLIFLSTYDDVGINEIKILLKDNFSVFAGPSGVGKSSIINKIYPRANMEVGEISKKIKRGKHTTRHVELLEIEENSYIIDSPGFTSLFFDKIEPEDLQYLFIEFHNYIDDCKFKDCIHFKENDCGVKNNIPNNISEVRYNRYLKFLEELKEGKTL